MDTKEIILPEGWVVDKIENNKIILKEEDKIWFDTWEKCFDKVNKVNQMYQIDDYSRIKRKYINGYPDTSDKNIVPEEYASPLLALMQLLVCHKAWVDDWKPKTDVFCSYYGVVNSANQIIVAEYSTCDVVILSFPTKEIAKKFLNTFKDLLEQAKTLL
jgi:hypothetical protein